MQLPLGISLDPGASFDAYFVGPNGFAVDLLRTMAAGEGERQVHVAGATGLGKSHLLQAACRAAAERGAPVAYLPLGSPGALVAEAMEGLEHLALVAVDDIGRVAGDPDWDLALFNLINGIRGGRARLVLADRRAPAELDVGLPDLASRLGWGPVVRLLPLADEAKREALIGRATLLGLELPPAVADHLIRHHRRDLPALFDLLDRLDRESLAAGRRLTLPFVRGVLGGAASR